MDTEQPFINKDCNSIDENQYPNPQEINKALNSGNNENLSNTPQEPNINPSNVLQFQNSSDIPESNDNQIENDPNQPEIDYSKYNNINQLPNRGIKQLDNNTMYVERKKCREILPIIIWILASLFFATIITWAGVNTGTIIASTIGGIFSLIGFSGFCLNYYKVCFQINPNNIRVREVACCAWRTKVYDPGQITSIDFSVNRGNEFGTGDYRYHYSIAIYQNIPDQHVKKEVFSIADDNQLFTNEEIGYFNYVMNRHIQTNLNGQNIQ